MEDQEVEEEEEEAEEEDLETDDKQYNIEYVEVFRIVLHILYKLNSVFIVQHECYVHSCVMSSGL